MMQDRFETGGKELYAGRGAGMQGTDKLEKGRRLSCSAIISTSCSSPTPVGHFM